MFVFLGLLCFCLCCVFSRVCGSCVYNFSVCLNCARLCVVVCFFVFILLLNVFVDLCCVFIVFFPLTVFVVLGFLFACLVGCFSCVYRFVSCCCC